MKRIKLKNDYATFILLGNDCYLKDGFSFGILNITEIQPLIVLENKFRCEKVDSHYIYIEDIYKEVNYLFDTKSYSFINGIDNRYMLIRDTNSVLILHNRSFPETICYDLKKNKLLWKKDFYISFFSFGDFLFDIDKESLSCYDPTNGNSCWQFTLNEERKYNQGEHKALANNAIERIIGLFENTLWVVTNLGHLLGISVETGVKVYHLTTPINIPTEWGNWQIFIEAQQSVIDYEQGILFGIHNNIYWECDLKIPEKTYLYYDISASCEKHQIKSTLSGYLPVWHNDEIFFGQQEWAKDSSFVGIFNRKTREITWTSREINSDLFKGLNKIDFANNKLYVLDREGTLTILSKFHTVA